MCPHITCRIHLCIPPTPTCRVVIPTHATLTMATNIHMIPRDTTHCPMLNTHRDTTPTWGQHNINLTLIITTVTMEMTTMVTVNMSTIISLIATVTIAT